MGRKPKTEDDVLDRKDSVIDVRSAEEKLGEELIAEIANKKWKTAELPSQEELEKEKHKSTKARSSPNSRKNLVQYQKKKDPEVKKKIVKGLTYAKKRADVDPFEYIQVPKDFDTSNLMAFLPKRQVFRNADEEIQFYTIVNSFWKDFDSRELSSADIEDIMSLAKNIIFEDRLLALSSADPHALLDVSSTIEKFRKHSDKVKSNLAARRSDRIDPRAKQNFSIVDLVAAFDDNKQADFEQKIRQNRKEENDFLNRKKKS